MTTPLPGVARPLAPLHDASPIGGFAAHDISDASRQLRALATLSGSLTDPLSPEQAADVVERHALSVLGATSAVIVTFGQFPRSVRIRFERAAQSIELDTDPLKLRQILVNLVTNAVKYTDHGDVMLLLRIEGLGVEMRIFFEVSDSGRGIAAADHEHVFEAFWRAERKRTPPSEGTGLGLSVARQLARLLGGDVELARSELGVGSTFIARLPARHPGQQIPGRV